jgi:probable HAF family extracellular repeat protein
MFRRCGRVLVVGVAALALGVAPAAARSTTSGDCTPQVIDLGTLGGSQSEIDGDNGRDTFVGSAQDASGHDHAVLWPLGGSIVDLGQPNAWAADMNNAGVVVGDAWTRSTGQYAFAWYDGRAIRLHEPSWASGDYVRRINDHDDAAGIVFGPHGHAHPAVWEHLTFLKVLPVPAGYSDAEVLGINNSGEVVGDASHAKAPYEQDAWGWREDGSNGPLEPDHTGGFGEANTVNERGWAAGGTDYGGKLGLWPTVWRRGSLVRLGPTGPGFQYGFPYGGDNSGDYVGGAAYSIDDNYLHVMLAHIGEHVLYTMPPLSGNLDDRSNAHAVLATTPDMGTVVGGDSTTSDGGDHATLWTCAWQQAVPQPAPSSNRVGSPAQAARSVHRLRSQLLAGLLSH